MRWCEEKGKRGVGRGSRAIASGGCVPREAMGADEARAARPRRVFARRARPAPSPVAAQSLPGPLPLPVPVPSPVPLSVEVVAPPQDPSAPVPTGTVTLSADGRNVMTRPVSSNTDLALAAATLAGFGQNVTITYSGDAYYEPSDPVTVALPTSAVRITARPRDTTAPVIEILAPGDGVRYDVGEPVAALYSCRDPEQRSAVTRCEGPVASGAAVDTTTEGRYSFAVHSADARGNTTSKTIIFRIARSDDGASRRRWPPRGPLRRPAERRRPNPSLPRSHRARRGLPGRRTPSPGVPARRPAPPVTMPPVARCARHSRRTTRDLIRSRRSGSSLRRSRSCGLVAAVADLRSPAGAAASGAPPPGAARDRARAPAVPARTKMLPPRPASTTRASRSSSWAPVWPPSRSATGRARGDGPVRG